MKRIQLFLLLLVAVVTSVWAQGYKVGDMATDFKLKNVDGRTVSLADFSQAKGFIIVFTCNHCPYAQAYQDRLIALDKTYKAKGYPVIAINPNDPSLYPEDSFSEMQKRAKEKSYTFPYLFDEGQRIFPVYGATKTPTVFVLQKTDRGNVVRYIGAIDDNYEDASAVKIPYVVNAVNDLLAGNPVTVTFTKAIGCGIKVK